MGCGDGLFYTFTEAGRARAAAMYDANVSPMYAGRRFHRASSSQFHQPTLALADKPRARAAIATRGEASAAFAAAVSAHAASAPAAW